MKISKLFKRTKIAPALFSAPFTQADEAILRNNLRKEMAHKQLVRKQKREQIFDQLRIFMFGIGFSIGAAIIILL